LGVIGVTQIIRPRAARVVAASKINRPPRLLIQLGPRPALTHQQKAWLVLQF